MAISNLLSIQGTAPTPKLDFGGSSSLQPRVNPFGMQTTTTSGVPNPLKLQIQPTPTAQPTSTTPASTSSTTGLASTNLGVSSQPAAVGFSGSTYNPTQPTPQQPTPQPKGLLTYPGLVGSVAGQGTVINQTAQNIGQAGQMTPEEVAARTRLESLQGDLNTRIAGIESHPSDILFQQGQTAVAGRQAAAEQQRLAGIVNAYAAERQASQAAYGQQATAQNMAGGQFGAAAGYSQPQQNFPFVFNPLTQTFGAPGVGGGTTGGAGAPNLTLNPTTDAQTLAKQIMSNGIGYQDAVTALSYGGRNPVADTQLASAITSLGGNPTVLKAQAQALTSNIQTGGTAGVQANSAVLNNAYSNYLSLQQTTQNIDGFGNLITQTMRDGGINPTDVKFANRTIAEIRNQLSSTQQAVYDNTLAGLRSRVSGLLAAGGNEIPSQITADATKILDGTLPLSALTGVLNRIQQEGNLLLTNAAGVVNAAYAGTQGTNVNVGQNAGGSPTTTNTPW